MSSEEAAHTCSTLGGNTWAHSRAMATVAGFRKAIGGLLRNPEVEGFKKDQLVAMLGWSDAVVRRPSSPPRPLRPPSPGKERNP